MYTLEFAYKFGTKNPSAFYAGDQIFVEYQEFCKVLATPSKKRRKNCRKSASDLLTKPLGSIKYSVTAKCNTRASYEKCCPLTSRH